MSQTDQITMKELVEARKQEMEQCLPGLQTEVILGDKTAIVESPGWFQRSKFRLNDK